MDLGFQVPQPLSKIGKLGSGDQVIIEILNHDTGKFDVLCRVSIIIRVGRVPSLTNFLFLKTVCQGSIDAFRTKTETELSDDKISTNFEKFPVRRKQLK